MPTFSKPLATFGLVAAAAVAGGCNDFLKVRNPAAVDVTALTDSANAGLLVNGGISTFQGMVTTGALWGGLIADESRSAHVNASYGPIDRRDFTNLNDILNGIYTPMQRARFAADTAGDYITGYVGEAAAARDLRIARMRAFAGYGYLYLGEQFCSAPINGGAPQTPQQLFQAALPRFDEAIAIARAVKGTATTTNTAADSILNLALVGAARANLNLNNRPQARQLAAQVPAAFVFRAYYTEGNPPPAGFPVNLYYNAMGSPDAARTGFNNNVAAGINYSSSSLWVVVDTAFENLKDPRTPMTPRRLNTMSSNVTGIVANQAASFGGHVKDTIGVPMTPGASIRVASGMEARYITAEVDGGTASTLAFVNAQRTANNQPLSVAATADAILADLRDQKRREFYLDGHRLGEIRRYKAQYNGLNFFPGSSAPDAKECFVIPIAEINSNPNAQN